MAVGTIHHGLEVVRRILNLAATEWLNEYGLTWLATALKIKLLPDLHKRAPYPLDWDAQTQLFQRLPDHLAQMALFAVNTGCRDGRDLQAALGMGAQAGVDEYLGVHHSRELRQERR